MAARARRQVGRVAAFWDSSALVPLCAHQALTPRARSLYQEYEVTVWWATPVEMASALARLLRMQQISVLDFRTAKRLATALSDIWWVVQPSELLRASALTLIEQYDLRAADRRLTHLRLIVMVRASVTGDRFTGEETGLERRL